MSALVNRIFASLSVCWTTFVLAVVAILPLTFHSVRKWLVGAAIVAVSALCFSNSTGAGILAVTLTATNGVGGGVFNIAHDDAFGFSQEGIDILDAPLSGMPPLPFNHKWVQPYSDPTLGTPLVADYRPTSSTSDVDVFVDVMHNFGGTLPINFNATIQVSIDNSDGAFDGVPILLQQTDASAVPVGSIIDLFSIVPDGGGRTLPFAYTFDGNVVSGTRIGGFRIQFSEQDAVVPEPSTFTIAALALLPLGFYAVRKCLAGAAVVAVSESRCTRS